MPYWDGTGGNSEEYEIVTAKLDAIISALRSSAPVIVAGDFNCALPQMSASSRPLQWHRLRGLTEHSARMQDLLDHNALAVAEFLFPQPVDFTYARGNCQRHIDHIAVLRSLLPRVIDCRILLLHPENLSPHLPIVCRVLVAAAAPCTESTAARQDTPAPCTEVLCWDSDDRVTVCRQTLDNLLDIQLPTCDDSLDALDATISRCLLDAARTSGCAKQRRRPEPWWTPATAAAGNRVRFWLQIWTSCGRSPNSAVHHCYRAARRAYRRARRTAALTPVQQEAQLLHSLRRDGNISDFWRRVQRVRRGPLPAGTTRTASEFGSHFEAVHQDDRTLLDVERSQLAVAIEARWRESRMTAGFHTVTPDQVAGLLYRLPLGKVPGADGVTVEHLRHGCSPALLAALARLLPACLTACDVPASSESVVVPLLKKSQLDRNCVDNYRPISLSTCVFKLLELLVLDELEASFTPHELQLGFISRRGTTEESLLASETVQWNRRRCGLPVYAANLDTSKCFENIWHDGLIERLASHFSPSNWLLMLTWYRRLTAHVAYGGTISDTFCVRRGTRQGDILSPVFVSA